MSYPPPHNGHYPPQYLQQQPPRQHPQQPIQPPQFLYNNINSVQSPQSPYQYGKPVVYPQVIPNFNSYAQAFNSQQHVQQPQPVPPPQPQYVNPVDLFQQPSVGPVIPPQFNTFGTSQYAGQPAASVANNNPDRSPTLPTISNSTQPTLYPPPSASPGSSNAYNQYPQVAPKQQATPLQKKPAPSPIPASTSVPAPAPVASPNPVPTTASVTMPSVPSSTPTVVPASISRSLTSTPTAPTPTAKQVPQMLIPAPSPEVQQKLLKQQAARKQGQAQLQGNQQTARKQGKPSVDYQVLLLSLADEYLNAAHNHGTTVASLRKEDDVEEYYKLLATGLGCLEAVLKVSGIFLFGWKSDNSTVG